MFQVHDSVMGASFLHACQLFDQRRYDLAEVEVRRLLAGSPNSADASALLGMCRVKRGFNNEGYEWGTEALRLDPTLPFAHYAMAVIQARRGRTAEARTAIDEAIRLEPTRPPFFFMKAALLTDDGRHQQALEAAEQGLRLSPEHTGCNSLRALALERLDRHLEAEAAIAEALRLNPESDFTHTAEGWKLLHRGRSREARAHFLEALRINPENQWALHGRKVSNHPLSSKTGPAVYSLIASLGLYLLLKLLIPTELFTFVFVGIALSFVAVTRGFLSERNADIPTSEHSTD
jgi:tetratricopeptide (TPR) repeat protein